MHSCEGLCCMAYLAILLHVVCEIPDPNSEGSNYIPRTSNMVKGKGIPIYCCSSTLDVCGSGVPFPVLHALNSLGDGGFVELILQQYGIMSNKP